MKASPLHPKAQGEPGRPRKFDQDAVLTAAAKVFWERGYHATSIDDLCEATGLLRGSLYCAFGDKRGILIAALDCYAEQRVERLAQSLESPHPSLEAFRQALLYYTRSAPDVRTLRACFITNTALEMIPQDREIAPRIESIFRRMAALLAAEYVRLRDAGLVASGLDEETVGAYLLSSIQGLRIMGKVYQEEELARIVDIILRALA